MRQQTHTRPQIPVLIEQGSSPAAHAHRAHTGSPGPPPQPLWAGFRSSGELPWEPPREPQWRAGRDIVSLPRQPEKARPGAAVPCHHGGGKWSWATAQGAWPSLPEHLALRNCLVSQREGVWPPAGPGPHVPFQPPSRPRLHAPSTVVLPGTASPLFMLLPLPGGPSP